MGSFVREKNLPIFLRFNVHCGNGYKELLESKFFPCAKKRGLVKTFHFLQDGATPQRTKEVFEAIYNVYGNRVIGLGYPKFAHGGIEWPPYSPDMNPCDFFLWGYIKDHCYSENPTTPEELMKAIKKTVNSISDEILSQFLYIFRKRIDCCSSGDDEHFENIYH